MVNTILDSRYVNFPRLFMLLDQLFPGQWSHQVRTIAGNPWPTKMKGAATECHPLQNRNGRIRIIAPVALTQVCRLLTCQAWSPQVALTLPQEQQDYIRGEDSE